LTTDLGILAGGLLAALSPTVLSAGFETSTGGSWNAFAAEQRRLADFMLAGFRLVGALNVVLGFTLFAVAVMALREGARWAWWIRDGDRERLAAGDQGREAPRPPPPPFRDHLVALLRPTRTSQR